jgi:hypothetical protein
MGPGTEDNGLGFCQIGHGVFLLFVVGGQEHLDARQQIDMRVPISAKVHVAIVVALGIGNRVLQGNGIAAVGETFDFPSHGKLLLHWHPLFRPPLLGSKRKVGPRGLPSE